MNANERPRLLQGIAWVESGTSAIDGVATRHIDPGIDVSRTRDGALVPNKPPGATIPAALSQLTLRSTHAPTLRLHTQVARALGGWLPWIVLLVIARRRREFDPFALVALTLATPCLAYTRLLYGHVLAGVCLWGGVRALDRGGREQRWAWSLLGGLVAGSAVAVEYLAAFAGIPIGAWLVLEARRRGWWPGVAAALLGALIPIAVLMAYQDALFGSPWSTPYHFVVREGFAEIHGRGLLGLTVPTETSVFEHLLSPWGGLLYWAPLTVVALGAMVAAVCRGEASSLERVSLAIVIVVFVLNLCLAQTGGWRVGPRYAVLAMPLLLPGLQRVSTWLARPVAGAVVVALLGWSLFVNYLAAGLFPHLVPEGNPLFELLLPLWADGMRPYSLWGAWGLGLSGLATLALFVAVTRPETAVQKRAWVAGAAGACGLVGLAALVPGSPAGEDSLTAVRRIWEPGGPLPPTSISLRAEDVDPNSR